MYQRHSVRLPGFDYSQNGWYFVTICSKGRNEIFGTIDNGEMSLNQDGRIVNMIWNSLPSHHPNITLNVYQIMPNHFHGILIIEGGSVVKGGSLIKGGSRPAPTKITKMMTLGNIIGLFKSECTKKIREMHKDPYMDVWQRGYYEHIIRNETAYNEIRKYILENPVQYDCNV